MENPGRIYINFFRKDMYTREDAAKFKEMVKAGFALPPRFCSYTWSGMLVDISNPLTTQSKLKTMGHGLFALNSRL